MSRYVLINMNSHPVDVDLKSGFPPVRIQPGVANAYKLGEVTDSELPGLQALRRINLVIRKELTEEKPIEVAPSETPVKTQEVREPETSGGQETPEETATGDSESADGQDSGSDETQDSGTDEAQDSSSDETADASPTKEELLAGRSIESLTNEELKGIVNALGLTIEGKLTRAKAIEAIKGA